MIVNHHHHTAERADRFLRSGAGRALIHRILATNRLPRSLADDLAQDALRRVWVTLTSGDGVIDSLEGFVTVVLNRAAVDIVRGRVRGPQAIDWQQGVDLDADGWGWPLEGPSPLDVEADALARTALVSVRRAVHTVLSIDPVSGGAALAYLNVAVDGAPVAPDCPQPGRGATPTDAAEWAALWYAGRRDCFVDAALGAPPPADAAASGAVRKRRSRHARRFRDRLLLAARMSGLEPEGVSHV